MPSAGRPARAGRIRFAVSIILVLILPVVGFSNFQQFPEVPAGAHADVGAHREFSLEPAATPAPDGRQELYRTPTPGDRLSNARSAVHPLSRACAGEGFGLPRAALRLALHAAQISVHTHLFLVPFCGHAPPSLNI